MQNEISNNVLETIETLKRITKEQNLKWYKAESGVIRLDCCDQKCVKRCPITELAYQTKNKNYGLGEAPEAGQTLNLTSEDMRQIVRAADNLVTANIRVRSLLLEACGLLP